MKIKFQVDKFDISNPLTLSSFKSILTANKMTTDFELYNDDNASIADSTTSSFDSIANDFTPSHKYTHPYCSGGPSTYIIDATTGHPMTDGSGSASYHKVGTNDEKRYFKVTFSSSRRVQTTKGEIIPANDSRPCFFRSPAEYNRFINPFNVTQDVDSTAWKERQSQIIYNDNVVPTSMDKGYYTSEFSLNSDDYPPLSPTSTVKPRAFNTRWHRGEGLSLHNITTDTPNGHPRTFP